MDASPRGVCVIINNEKFKGSPERKGSTKDADSLCYIFKKLDFKVLLYKNQTAEQMKNLLEGISDQNHENYDCFVCCILSHGSRGPSICGTDNNLIRVNQLTGYFRASECESLAGKPKLFFIQACQGSTRQKGYEHADFIQKPQSKELWDFHSYQPEMKYSDDIDLTRPDSRMLLPDEADFVLGYATLPGYVSFRNEESGSWFISMLVPMLDTYASKHDLLSILVKVNEEVAKKVTEDGQYKQISAPMFTLRKKLFF